MRKIERSVPWRDLQRLGAFIGLGDYLGKGCRHSGDGFACCTLVGVLKLAHGTALANNGQDLVPVLLWVLVKFSAAYV